MSLLEAFRDRAAERHLYGANGDDDCGVFTVSSAEDDQPLRVIASAGGGWDHVSVSRADRTPTWGEMEQIATMFFGTHEDAMQLHVPKSDHVNCHPFCLHWWRPQMVKIPRPPSSMVGPKR